MTRAHLGKFIQITSGFAFPSEYFNAAEGMPLIRIRDVVRGRTETRYTGPYDTSFIVDDGDLLVGMDGEFNACVWRGGPALLNQRVCKIVPDSDHLDFAYLCHVLPRELKAIEARTPFVTVKHLSVKEIRAIELNLPSLTEQQRIAAILDKADSIRRKRQEAIHLADKFLRAKFIDMFGDPVSNPKGWQVKRLADLGSLDRGISKHRPRNDPSLLGGSHPLIQTGEVANCDGYIRSYTSTYSDKGLLQSKLWPAGTLCITIAANIAKTGILLFPACFPDSVVGFTASETATVEYVRFWLSFLQKTLEANAPESAQKNINLAILRDLQIAVPPIELIRKFAAVVLATESIRVAHRKSLQEGLVLSASLQHELLA